MLRSLMRIIDKIYVYVALVGCLWLNGPLRQYFQSISGRLPERGRKKREVIDE